LPPSLSSVKETKTASLAFSSFLRGFPSFYRFTRSKSRPIPSKIATLLSCFPISEVVSCSAKAFPDQQSRFPTSKAISWFARAVLGQPKIFFAIQLVGFQCDIVICLQKSSFSPIESYPRLYFYALKPTIKARVGYKFSMHVNRDIVFDSPSSLTQATDCRGEFPKRVKLSPG
jgi:hypothetical protein